MSYEVRQPSVSAAVGAGLGSGLSEQIPREIGRYRLASGLKQFSDQSSGMTPMQQITGLLSIPGVSDSPQMMQVLGDMAKQGAFSRAIKQAYGIDPEEEAQPTPGVPTNQMAGTAPMGEGFQRSDIPSRGEASALPQQEMGGAPSEDIPTLGTKEGIEATLSPFIPRTEQQIARDASRNNPQLFEFNPQSAMDIERRKDVAERERREALESRRIKEAEVENKIRSSLRDISERMGSGSIPGDVYADIERDAIRAVKDGRLTESQAAQEYGKKMRDRARDYSNVRSLRWSLLPGKQQELDRSINALQKTFKEEGDLENFGDTLVAQGYTPTKSYSKAYPLKDFPELRKEIEKMKRIPRDTKGLTEAGIMEFDKLRKSREEKMFPILANKLGKEASPLSVAHELYARDYDPVSWLNYLDENRKKLNLSERQIRELGKDRSALINLKDLWLESGLY